MQMPKAIQPEELSYTPPEPSMQEPEAIQPDELSYSPPKRRDPIVFPPKLEPNLGRMKLLNHKLSPKWMKPPVPYKVDFQVTIQQHNPAPPHGPPYRLRREHVDFQLPELYSQLDICLAHPPLLGQPIDNPTSMTIQIIQEIAVCDKRGAQLALCKVAGTTLVAKFYDPLYYPTGRKIFDYWMEAADNHYTCEAAAYTELDPHFGGRQIPKYHGSWTCNIDTPTIADVISRPVRLILLEYVNGLSLHHLPSKGFTLDQQLEIMSLALEAEVEIFHQGVRHGDFAPRNVVHFTDEAGNHRVKIVDFGMAIVERLVGRVPHKDKFRRPHTPAMYSVMSLREFQILGWLPSDEMAQEWLDTRWKDDLRYEPPSVKWVEFVRKMKEQRDRSSSRSSSPETRS